jgi:hypothetical protein
MSSESTAEAQKVIDRKILTAIQILSETLNALRNGADEATMANVEAWIENNKAELGQRISVSWKRSPTWKRDPRVEVVGSSLQCTDKQTRISHHSWDFQLTRTKTQS